MRERTHVINRVIYPFEEAVQKAAEQNFNRDFRLGLVEERDRVEEMEINLEEARVLLKETGENYLPEFPDTEHICVEKS